MARSMNIKKGDQVRVVAGQDKGAEGKVIAVLSDQRRVIVEGVNRVYKHLKGNRRNMQGGRLSREMPIAASNALLYCTTCRKGVRIGHRYESSNGRKFRICRKCNNDLGAVGRARPAYAKK